MQCEALRVLHKVLLSILPSKHHVELHEFLKLLTVAENATQYPVSMKSCLAIHILADLCCRKVVEADIDKDVFCCSYLASCVISLIKDHIKLLVMPSLEACQNDLTICQHLQSLLKILLAIVERHPNLGSLVLDNIKAVIECLASTDHAILSTHLAVNFKVQKNNFFILRPLRKIYRFLVACLENIYKAGAINTEVLNSVKILVELVCECSLIDFYTYSMYHMLLHNQPICGGLVHKNDETWDYYNLSICPHGFVKCKSDTLEFVNMVLTRTDGWTAYKVGAHAACQGEWLVATSIFKTLIEKVKSDSCCNWLKALFNYANSEGMIQLLSLPIQGTTSMELLENIKFPSTCDYMNEKVPRIVGHINDCHYCDKLTASHAALCSSLGILEASATSSRAFCFQRWYLSLRVRVLENLVDMLKALTELSLKIDWNHNQVELEISGMLGRLKCHQVISRISFQFHRLAEEFDLIGSSFIGIDSESSAVLAAHGLSCSVLAFVVGFGVSNIDQHSHQFSSVEKTSCNLQALTIQSLLRWLWFVDHETRTSLSLLLNYFDQNKNCFSLQPIYRNWNLGYEDREVLNVCSFAVSGSVHLHNVETPSEATKNALLLIFNTLIKWTHIRFRVPKYFFKVRQFMGSEIFVHSDDSENGVDISVLPGFHLTLNIGIQLKNVPPNLHVKPIKLYCILHCSTSFQVPGGQTLEEEHLPSGYQAWKDNEIVELNKKLFSHVSDCMAGERRIGMHNRDGGNTKVAETFLQFEPNEKGQGFSHCLLNVSDFPVGSYRIKWHSCLIDSQGSYRSILPLNLGPVLVIKPVVG